MTRSAAPQSDTGPGDEVPDPFFLRIPESRWAEAVERLRLFSASPDGGAAETFLRVARERGLDLDQFWGLQDQTGRLAASFLAIPNPGRTALVFCSPPTWRCGRGRITELIRRSGAALDASRIALAQALLERHERELRRCFEEGGFRHLADISYMEARLPPAESLPEPRWPEECEFETYLGPNEPNFIRAIESSYEQTQDCPDLCGLRETQDVVRGHQHNGVFDPDLWTLVRIDGEPAAVLLLSPMPDGQRVELTYLGVGGAFRRRGLAEALVALGKRQSAQRRATRMVLAVDESNGPAIRLYERAGFFRTERRIALIRPVR